MLVVPSRWHRPRLIPLRSSVLITTIRAIPVPPLASARRHLTYDQRQPLHQSIGLPLPVTRWARAVRSYSWLSGHEQAR
jgi:hypothetical protein